MSNQDRVAKYAYISYEKRLKAIDLMTIKGFTIQRTARFLKIKPSTTRMILKKYKE
jgi:hypothetical protein